MSSILKEKKARPLVCVVTSDKMNKSRVGTVSRMVKHARYGKYMKRRSKVMFHDEQNESRQGDKVLVSAGRPRSHSKAFELVKVLEKARE